MDMDGRKKHSQKGKLEMEVGGWWLVAGGWNVKLTKPGLPTVWTSFALLQQRFPPHRNQIDIHLLAPESR